MYKWGPSQGDVDLLNATEHWTKYYRCKEIPLNGKAGALFFYERLYTIRVSFTLLAVFLVRHVLITLGFVVLGPYYNLLGSVSFRLSSFRFCIIQGNLTVPKGFRNAV